MWNFRELFLREKLGKITGLFILLFLYVMFAAAQQTNIAESSFSSRAKIASLDYVKQLREAQQYFKDKKYKQAIEAIKELLKVNPADGNNWAMLASSHYELKEFEEAISAYTKASELGFLDPAQAAYQAAKCYAFLGKRDAALSWLNKSLQSRYRNRIRIANDDAFKSLRDDPRFRLITGQIKTDGFNRLQGWKTDLDYLISEVKRVHYRYSREPLSPEFLRAANDIRDNIPRLSDAEIVIKLQGLISLLGDGHTLIYPFGMKLGSLKRLPLGFYQFSDGLFIIDAPDEYKNLIGKKVLKFGQSDAQTVLKNLEPFVSRDNPMGIKWVGATYLTFTDYLKALGAITDREKATLLLENVSNGTQEKATITAKEVNPDEINIKLIPLKIKSPAPVPVYLSRVNENYWFEKFDEKTVYFQFNQVQNQSKEPLSAFAQRLRQFLDENNTENLIIDVRHNNGGEASILGELYRTLIHFETTRKQGKIYVLIGRDTFSAAQTFISVTDNLTSAVFAGEPSGSKPNRVGDEAQFVLPYSKVLGSIASGYNQAASKDNRIWIAPDIPIELSSGDYFSNRDPVLETVIKAIKDGTM